MIHDHEDYLTPMRVWISQQRRRLKKDFEVAPIAPGKGKELTQYYIWWTRKWRKGQRHQRSTKLPPHTLNLIKAKFGSLTKPSLNGTGSTVRKERKPLKRSAVSGSDW